MCGETVLAERTADGVEGSALSVGARLTKGVNGAKKLCDGKPESVGLTP